MTTILHIEDDLRLQAGCLKMFRRLYPGCILMQCSTAHAAVAELHVSQYDIVVSDFDLAEGTTGLNVLVWVQRHIPEQRFMFMAGNVLATTLGVPCVEKPASRDELGAAMKELLK